ncbi:MAG: nucleotidyl transferase AbiEii/AbiGii toxin family protein [Frankiaceae bacterium]|nr:nucleotidyl transferase AbiEii/AbiGii toxin family protein [Frankiaceae bacterium]MBV9871940.1 nucleotidyl transferase AbiEii/AbiGii toxin family protein [Frankiaceae bacterium]
MLDPVEGAAIAAVFDVSDEQVRRDHLISHLLAALATHVPDAVVFFGGTALARTHLPDGRLSEDIDLYAQPNRLAVVDEIETTLETGILREYGRLTWSPPLSAVKDTLPAILRTSDGLTVRVQLLDPAHHPDWPTERRGLHQRYSDAPAATLTVLTLPAFAASKTTAWNDRHAPRDLYDLWGLAALGAIDREAASLFARHGPTGHPPRAWMFRDAPTIDDWRRQLSSQTRIAVDPADALTVVREAWDGAVGGIP